MAKLTREDVIHVAKLSNLDISASEVSKFQDQISAVIDYIEELKEVNIERISPTSQTTGLENVTREDVVNPTRVLDQASAVSEANIEYNGYFQVPPVIEKKHDDR